MTFLNFVVVSLIIINLFRMSIYVILSNLEIVRASHRNRANRNRKGHKSEYLPTVTVLIPAHNEGLCIAATLKSVCQSVYPSKKLSIIVINDGSTDDTKHVVKSFIQQDTTQTHIRLINQKNKGKAGALNYALKRYVNSTLVMTLDADSLLEKRAIRNSAAHFKDQLVIAASSNVNIIEDDTILGLAQRFEYAIGYQMKRAEALGNVEYIIGGVGAMFRTTKLREIGYYDTNTQTEDIDLTLKLLNHFGNKTSRFTHAHDAITYTQPVQDVSSLVKQRLRWKYGRWQSFLKHRSMFFNTSGRYSRSLTWAVLPYSLLQELMLLIEPVAIFITVYYGVRYGDSTTFLFAIVIVTGYIMINLWASDNLSVKERARLSYYAIPMYLILYLVSYVEYLAIIFGMLKIGHLRRSIEKHHTTWKSPDRVVLTNA